MDHHILRRPRRKRAERDLGAQFSPEQIAQAMEHAGVDPALIHAFRKTGFMPTEETLDLFSEGEIEEWHDAVTEYRQREAVTAAGGAAWATAKH